MKHSDFTKTVMKMAEESPDFNQANVKRLHHFYRDNTTAMMDHITNMMTTYGKEQLNQVLKSMKEEGIL